MRLIDWIKRLGPGLITGAADDDPSGIATYSQVGAQFGFTMLWTAWLSYPFMVTAQLTSARIGRVTGHGIAFNLKKFYPPWLLYGLVTLLLVANVVNLAADLGAMGQALQLLIGGPSHFYVLAFGGLCAALQVFLPYPRYVPYLKWLTLALFAYVITVFMVDVPWGEVTRRTLIPTITFDRDFLVGLTAVLGTTISPYLFFWQASHEAEEQRATSGELPLKRAPAQAPRQLAQSSVDTYAGMTLSNLVAYFIILAAAVTLHAHGVKDIQTSAQAAEALRPLAGDLAFVLFSAGIIGTGLLGVPVLAGSAAYAVSEAFRWRVGLARSPAAAGRFYAVLSLATLLGVLLNFLAFDAIKMLYWSAVINGIAAAPALAAVVKLATDKRVMGRFTIGPALKILGWATAAVMMLAATCVLMTLRT
jgi:NRAMP (natural resistance-associated macrophage protein)-like metal ion transporter